MNGLRSIGQQVVVAIIAGLAVAMLLGIWGYLSQQQVSYSYKGALFPAKSMGYTNLPISTGLPATNPITYLISIDIKNDRSGVINKLDIIDSSRSIQTLIRCENTFCSEGRLIPPSADAFTIGQINPLTTLSIYLVSTDYDHIWIEKSVRVVADGVAVSGSINTDDFYDPLGIIAFAINHEIMVATIGFLIAGLGCYFSALYALYFLVSFVKTNRTPASQTNKEN